MSLSKITIITVSYNCADSLECTIKSVMNQSYLDKEYIIIDGASSDNTCNIIKKYENMVTKYISEPDYGIYDAMNKGIDLATGEWIIFMNSGDVFHDNYVIENVFSDDFDDNIGIVYGDIELLFSNGLKVLKRMNHISEERIPMEICHQAVFTRTYILKEIKYDLSYKIIADRKSFIDIYKMGMKFKYVPFVISEFDSVKGVSSKKQFKMYRELKRLNGENIYSLKNIPSTILNFLKSLCFSILPNNFLSVLRSKLIASRKLYK